MSLGSIAGTGMDGIQRGLAAMQKNANTIAHGATEGLDLNLSDVAEAAIGLKQSELQVKASIAVVKSANDTLGSLLDVFA